MPREVYTYTYTYDKHSYLPLAPFSNDSQTAITQVYNDIPLEIFDKNNKSVGKIFLTGQSRVISDEKLLNPKLYAETIVIYFNENNIKNLSYVRYDNVWFENEKLSNLLVPYTQKATATGGRFAGKNVTITEKRISELPERNKLIINY